MQISRLRIENFRSIKLLDLTLNDTTVFIGPNNAGKSAILEAVKIALSRRWGQRGTGFTENDVHLAKSDDDPRTAPPVKISFEFQEPTANAWPEDMVAELEDIVILNTDGLNKIAFSINYVWDEVKETFEPTWEFLNSSGQALPPKKRSINLSGFYNYILFMWLGALRDVDQEFNPRARNWGGLLKSIKISPELEATIKKTLDDLDDVLLRADPKFAQISDTIGKATEIAIEDSPGAAKIRMLPLDVWDMLSRAGIILRNESLRPWLPLGHHGQGLQSLSVIFLFQIASALQIADDLNDGTEPIFAIEEPEAHLHPQAARTLWQRISEMPGQKLVTTHSPYFVQNVPLHNLKIARFSDGSTSVSNIPTRIASEIPWSTEVNNLIVGRRLNQFVKNEVTNTISAVLYFDEKISADLADCFKNTPTHDDVKQKIQVLRHACRILISEEDEKELSFLGRRLRGEIFFARKWILVEGVGDFMLLHALGENFGYDLDQHGVAVIDFQNNGNAGIYAALAESFEFPWYMVVDGDKESEKFKKQLIKRGFSEQDLSSRFSTLTVPNCLEDQLIVDGNESLLRNILNDLGDSQALTCDLPDFLKKLKNKKTAYMAVLAPMVVKDRALANKMPRAFINIINLLKGATE